MAAAGSKGPPVPHQFPQSPRFAAPVAVLGSDKAQRDSLTPGLCPSHLPGRHSQAKQDIGLSWAQEWRWSPWIFLSGAVASWCLFISLAEGVANPCSASSRAQPWGRALPGDRQLIRAAWQLRLLGPALCALQVIGNLHLPTCRS